MWVLASETVTKAESFWESPYLVGRATTAVVIFILAVIAITFIGRLIQKVVSVKLSRQAGMVTRKLFTYIAYIISVAVVLNHFGVKIGPLLGAAGIGAVAVGFAAQTSLSNVISGLFLIAEKPFKIGDLVTVDGVEGVVENIGLLSMTMTTFENKSVRVPNETLVKSIVTNISRHPTRRFDMKIGVAYHEDIEHVIRVLRTVAEENEYCLKDPEPFLMFDHFADSSLIFKVGLWCKREDYVALRNAIAKDIKAAFEKENIEIPYPHLTIATGKANAISNSAETSAT